MIMKRILTGTIAAMCLNTAAFAATIDGRTVQVERVVQFQAPIKIDLGTFVVAAGTELTTSQGDLDISGASLTLSGTGFIDTGFSAAIFNGYVVSDVDDAFDPFVSASILVSQAVVGMPEVTFTDDSLFINLAGVTFFDDGNVLDDFLRVGFSTGPAIAAVPLPAGFPLLLLGLFTFGVLRRRQSN